LKRTHGEEILLLQADLDRIYAYDLMHCLVQAVVLVYPILSGYLLSPCKKPSLLLDMVRSVMHAIVL